MTTDTN